MFDFDDPANRSGFLNFAALFEGGLMLSAFVVGWIVVVDPVADLHLNWQDAGLGVLCALPMLGLFWFTHRSTFAPLERITRFLVEMIGPFLANCRIIDLVLLATLAGVCEEIVFRGFLQPWIGRLGATAGLVGSNVLFALAHFVTPTYAICAFLIGLYLAALMHVDLLFGAENTPNLLVPIVTHAVYDFVAFLMVVRAFRKQEHLEHVE